MGTSGRCICALVLAVSWVARGAGDVVVADLEGKGYGGWVAGGEGGMGARERGSDRAERRAAGGGEGGRERGQRRVVRRDVPAAVSLYSEARVAERSERAGLLQGGLPPVLPAQSEGDGMGEHDV